MLLPLDAFPFKLNIGFTVVELPLDDCAKISLAIKFTASILLPLDEEVSTFKAFPITSIELPLDDSREIKSVSTLISISLPLDESTVKYFEFRVLLLLIVDPLDAFKPVIDLKFYFLFFFSLPIT